MRSLSEAHHRRVKSGCLFSAIINAGKCFSGGIDLTKLQRAVRQRQIILIRMRLQFHDLSSPIESGAIVRLFCNLRHDSHGPSAI